MYSSKWAKKITVWDCIEDCDIELIEVYMQFNNKNSQIKLVCNSLNNFQYCFQ